MKPRRITLNLGAAAGGVSAAALLSTAVAVADPDIYVPDPATFDPYEAQGDPPFLPDSLTGTERWTNTTQLDSLTGVDTQTSFFGTVINDDFIVKVAPQDPLRAGTEIDLTNLGFGFENEFISEPALNYLGNAAPTITDVLITPFGDFVIPLP